MLFLLLSGLFTLPLTLSKCQDGWSQFGTRCYRMYTTTATWTNSEQNCVSVGGHLASVHSSKEYTFIQALVLTATKSNANTWLGGSDAAKEGVWVWSDGSAFDYRSWTSGEPSNGLSENCLMMNFRVYWNDAPCTTLLPSVCAKPNPPDYVTIMRLEVNSNEDLTVSGSSQLFLQQLKEKLIGGGLPRNFILRLRTINKKIKAAIETFSACV